MDRRTKKYPRYDDQLGMDHLSDVVGNFRKEFLDLKETDYDFLRKEGALTLSKAMAMDVGELEDLVLQCRNGLTSYEIREKVEALQTKDLEKVLDGTYMNGQYYFH